MERFQGGCAHVRSHERCTRVYESLREFGLFLLVYVDRYAIAAIVEEGMFWLGL